MLPWLEEYQQQFLPLLAQRKLAHGLLLSGPVGVGKRTLANWLAASLLCTASDGHKPCQQCKSCLLRQAGNHSDLLIAQSSATSIGVDAVRQIGQFMYGRAQQQQNKVVLLAEAEKLTESAANALLKTLEEPPADSFIILQTIQPAVLTATLLSRCQHWSLAAQFGLSAQQWLTRHSNRPVPEFLLAYCGGGPVEALRLLENGDADKIQLALTHLQQFFRNEFALHDMVKLLDSSTQSRHILGWYLKMQLMPAASQVSFARQQQMYQSYSRWCRDEQQILGQNKPLALSALLTELKRLSR